MAGDHLTAAGIFDDDNALTLADADVRHWWFRSKAALVSWAIQGAKGRSGWLVDIGAGSAGVTSMLDWRAEHKLAVDGNAFLVAAAARRHAVHTVQGDAGRVPVRDGAAAVVCLLDVIEHIPDPGPTLVDARRMLAPGGRLVVTVPGHPRLWSQADEALGHVRRYSRPALATELRRAGFQPTFLSHVFSWLVAPVWVKRRGGGGGDDPGLGLDVASPAIDRMAAILTRVERAVIRRVGLPMGTSILCVATVSGPRSAEQPRPRDQLREPQHLPSSSGEAAVPLVDAAVSAARWRGSRADHRR